MTSPATAEIGVVTWGEAAWGLSQLPAGLTNVLAVAAGGFHSLVLKADGTVVAWGDNEYGQTNVPAGLSDVMGIAAGLGHSVAVRSNGTVVAWGAGMTNPNTHPHYGQSIMPAGLSNVKAVFAGYRNSAALRNDGRVVEWGNNLYGQNNVPATLTTAIAVAGVNDFSLALRNNGTVLKWGASYSGLGSVPAGLNGVSAIGAGRFRGFAVRTNGTMVSWGTSYYGEGVVPPGLNGVTQVACGEVHTVALRTNGTVFAWGDNSSGQTNVPPGLSNVVALSAGWFHTMALVDDGAPLVLTQPASRTHNGGTMASFTVGIHGQAPLHYQWRKNDDDLTNSGNVSGANTSTLTLTGVRETDAAGYSVVVTNSAGSCTSVVATLTVVTAPVIDAAPASRTNNAGTTATFSVGASGTVPLSYQWRKEGDPLTNGVTVTGVNTATLTLVNVQEADAADYSVVVTNVDGAIASAPAHLTVFTAPMVLTHPASRTNATGSTASYTVVAGGQATLNYQWQKDGMNLSNGGRISGATSPTLAITSVNPSDVAHYRVVVGNTAGVVASGEAKLAVLDAPVIVAQPAGRTNVAGRPLSFTVGVTGAGPMHFQWRKNGLRLRDGPNVSGANSPTLSLGYLTLAESGVYSVTISNLVGSVTSLSSRLLVTVPHARLLGWGYNNSGQSSPPATVNNLIALASGPNGSHALALQADGNIVSWGANSAGQANVSPLALPAVGIGTGDEHSLAIKPDGTITGWGGGFVYNWPEGLSGVVDIGGGQYHSAALRSNGTVVAWGADYYGQLQIPAGLSNVMDIAVGSVHTLALRHDGSVAAWGDNYYGECDVPDDLTNAVAMACGQLHSLALRSDGTLAGWGYGYAPNLPAGLTNIIGLGSGGSHALALKRDGTITVWGWNYFGQSSALVGLSNVVAVAGGYGHSLAVVNQSPPVPPRLQTFSPPTAASGEIVTLTGENFSPIPAENVVYFGSVRGDVLTATANHLVVRVPPGAIYAPITVTRNGLVGSTTTPFQPTFFGRGDRLAVASFAPRFDLAAGDGPHHTAIADLDGDGRPDVVVANLYNHTLSLFRNLGTPGALHAGSFGPRVDLPAIGGTDNPYGLWVADVDGDGKLDVLACDRQTSQVLVYRNLATVGSLHAGSLAAPVRFNVGLDPRAVRVADINGDGRPDILCANYGGSTISLLQNIGTAGSLTSASFAPRVDLPAGSGAYDLTTVDLDGDGWVDVAAVNIDGNSLVSVYRNLGAATVSTASFAARVDLPAPAGAITLTAGDLDGDGQPDLVLGSWIAQTVSVYRNIATPGVLTAGSFASRVDFQTPGRTHTVVLGDLNGDQRPDLSVVSELDSALSLFANLSTPGSFTASSLASRVDLGTGWNAWGVSVGDLDGDGRPDVIFSNAYDDTLTIYQNWMSYGDPPVIIAPPQDQFVNVGDTATFAVVTIGTPPFQYQWIFNGMPLDNAPNASLILTNVQFGQRGNYSVIVSNGAGFVTSAEAVLTVNRPPQAANDMLSRSSGAAAKISVAELLANDLDADGDLLTLVNVATTSAEGGSVVRVGDWISYTPPAGNSAADSFAYTVSDGRGGSSSALVQAITTGVGEAASPNIVSVEIAPEGTRIVFAGIPTQTYLIQATTNLVSPAWETIGSGITGANGLLEFTDTQAAHFSSRYYRTAQP